jgi:short-subunit dehydrogenase
VELKHDHIAVTSIHPVGTKTDFFTTAEAVSVSRLPKRHGVEVQQTAEAVAARIVGGIERPRAEVWPYRVARVALSVATLFPGVVDRALSKRKPRG